MIEPKEPDWTKLIAGILIAVVVTAAVGIGLWFLLKYHRKKMLEGTDIDEDSKKKKKMMTAEAAEEAAKIAQEKLD